MALLGCILYVQHAGRNRLSDEEFLERMRREASEGGGSEDGTLPSIEEDPSLTPVLEVEPAQVLDLGTVSNAEATISKLLLHNRGKAPLIVTNVETTCACSRPFIEDAAKTIPPGGTSEVKIVFDPARVPGFESRKTVTVLSSAPNLPKAEIDVVAKVDPEFLLEPAEIDFGVVEKGAGPFEKVMLFRQLTPERVQITEVSVPEADDVPDVAFVEKPADQWLSPDRTEYSVTVRLPEDVSPGAYTGRFDLVTTCRRISVFPILVKAEVQAQYRIEPLGGLVIRHTSGAETPQPLRVTISAAAPLEVADVRTSAEDLLAVAEATEGEDRVVLKLSLAPDARPGRRSEKVYFAVRAGGKTVLDHVTVQVFVSDQPKA